jgi:hypothetical protein
LRNAPLTLAVLAGLMVPVTLLVAAPMYLSALADMGQRTTLAQAPLDQRVAAGGRLIPRPIAGFMTASGGDARLMVHISVGRPMWSVAEGDDATD